MKTRWMVAACLVLPNLFGCGSVEGVQSPQATSSESGTASQPASADESAADSESLATPENNTAACGAMTRRQCMDATSCTLVLAPSNKDHSGEYLCRPAAGACEVNLAQSALTVGTSRAEADESVKLCTSRPGCKFKTNDCYCDCNGYGRTSVGDGNDPAGSCLCFCAGGAPDACVPEA